MARQPHESATYIMTLMAHKGPTMEKTVQGPNATGVAESLEPYNMLAAELHLQEEALRRLQEANKPMFASSVEDEQAMLQALRQGFSGVSTASPMQLQQALHAWRAECQARDINPSILPNTV